MPVRLRGGLPLVDVRDLAQALSAAIEAGRGPRRYLVGGPFVTFRALARGLSELTGRPIRGVDVPAGVLLPGLRALDLLQRRVPLRLPAHFGGAWVLAAGVPTDDRRAETELGFRPRPRPETLADALRSLVHAGRLPARLAGRLMGSVPP